MLFLDNNQPSQNLSGADLLQALPLPLDMIMISTADEQEMAMIVNMVAAKTNEVISFL